MRTPKGFGKQYFTSEDDSPNELLNCQTQVINSKPCHCNRIFKQRTSLAVHIYKFIPRCPYYNTFFAFRRSGVHPPRFSF